MTLPRSVAVIGAGTMGEGIAQICALAGFEVILFDRESAQLDRARTSIQRKLSRDVEKGTSTSGQVKEAMQLIRTVNTLQEALGEWIIEAATERLAIKQDIFKVLEAATGGKAVLATNTSSLSVRDIASILKNPGQCIGIHFFNPAERMQLVEVISGPETSPEITDQAMDFVQKLGKTPVRAKDSPGFIVNRVARHFYTEAFVLEESGVASIKQIDALMRSAGFRMGPFELMDLIGVDTNLSVTKSIHQGMGSAHRFKPSALQERLVKEGHFGRKTGKGFYAYETK